MNLQQVRHFLSEVPLFSGLSESELDRLSEICRERTFDKGQVIFYEEDMGTSFYIIVDGQVKIVMQSEDGREHILGVLRGHDFFGEMSLLDGEPRSATAIALEQVKVLSIARDEFTALLRQVPDITVKIMVILSRRLRRADRHVESLAFLSAPGRVARVLIELSKEHGSQSAEGMVFDHRMTRQELANLAGTSRETLTRVIMDFQDEGLLTLKKNQVVLHNLRELENRII